MNTIKQHDFESGFTEQELDRARDAGASRAFIRVAAKYPTSSAGQELRKHLDWGAITEMAEARNRGNEDYMSMFLGSPFSRSLYSGQLRTAFAHADRVNVRLLVKEFGVPPGVNFISEGTVEDVETRGVSHLV